MILILGSLVVPTSGFFTIPYFPLIGSKKSRVRAGKAWMGSYFVGAATKTKREHVRPIEQAAFIVSMLSTEQVYYPPPPPRAVKINFNQLAQPAE
jgi:hypothetical protein